ncbi:MAG: putative FMN-dependent luciferase-like monooxygenase [Cellulomonas sp.]
MTIERLGIFTRLLDGTSDGSAYRLALEQIELAEDLGYDSAWVAQHHFDPDEGGLPSPLVFLAAAAARTSRLRLGTAVVTLPLEHVLRLAEDVAVLDQLSGRRLELGLAAGGTPRSFAAFGLDPADRNRIFTDALERLVELLGGAEVAGPGRSLFPDGRDVLTRLWQATFSAAGGARAGAAGHGLQLSRTQPRTADGPSATLSDLQRPIVRAYRDALPDGAKARVAASRSVLVGRNHERVVSRARAGVARFAAYSARNGHPLPDLEPDALLAALDVHHGTPEEVITSLLADDVALDATDLLIQVHPTDPGQESTLESIELFAADVAPELGWHRSTVSATPVLEGIIR